MDVASNSTRGFVPAAEHNTISCSWGGNIVREADGQYSLIASAMLGHCGINAWGHNSEIFRAVAASPEGSFAYKERGARAGVRPRAKRHRRRVGSPETKSA